MGLSQIALTVVLGLVLMMMYAAEYRQIEGTWYYRAFMASANTAELLAKYGLFILGLLILQMFITNLY